MSGVAAMLAPRGSACDVDALDTMIDAMPSRGPHGSSAWHHGHIGIGHLALHATPESRQHAQPHIDARSGVVIALDGRIDNREDLRRLLGASVSSDAADVAFVAAAYGQWGSGAFERLIGEFAVVLWDPRAQRLVCARDIMGVRPLCYARMRDGGLLVASEHRALLATGLVDDTVNEARALEFLGQSAVHMTETLFTSIQRLAPAHVMATDGSAFQMTRFWDLDSTRTIRYRSETEYAEHARHLIAQAVRACSRSVQARVGVSLSGGVDSSALTLVAATEGIDVEAFSMIFPGHACDESAYITEVASAAGVPSTQIPYVAGSASQYSQGASEYCDIPDYPNSVMADPLRQRAAASGLTVLLSGTGGDEWFTGSPYHHADWLLAGRWGTCAQQFASDAGARGARMAVRDLVMHGLWLTTPESARRLVKRVVGGRRVVPEWIPPPTAAKHDLEQRIAHRVTPRPGETFAQADMRDLAMSGAQVLGEEADDRSSSRVGIEQRYPFYDRRIIEFAYAVPDEQRWFGRFTKRMLRNAVPELPASVRWRRSKAEFSRTVTDALAVVDAAGIGGTRRIAARGWIDPRVIARLQEVVRRTSPDDHLVATAAWPLWMCFALEYWLEHLETRRTYVRPTGTPIYVS